ncbi:MAG: protein kinase [Alphaproteobacteria bacterium]|nr:protein kinase [Alphaproteobacteria bacterium]
MSPGGPDDAGSAWGLPVDDVGPAPDGATGEALATPEADRYAVVGPLGEGGMGVVDAVADARLGRQVARKRPHPGVPTARAIELLAHEAQVTARLDHPNVVPVHDAGIGPDGVPFLTLRLLDSRPLDALLDDPPPLPRLVRHLLDACHGVAHAHARGVVHADLKPSNVLVGERGETWVADWGLAHVVGEQTPPVAPGAGTPAWTAPEVARGAPPSPAADVFALGRVLDAVCARSGTDDAALRAVVVRATATDPTARYPDAGALADELERWLDGRRVSAHVYTSAELAGLLVRAWRGPLVGIGLAALMVGIVAGVSAVRTARERDRATAAEAQLQQTVRTLWVDRAVTAQRAGRDRDAADAARAALALGPSPRAEGVLLATSRGGIVPEARAPLSGCDRWVRRIDDGWLCGDGRSVLHHDDAGAVVGSWPVEATDAVLDGDGLLAIDGDGVVRFGAGGPSRRWRASLSRGLVAGGGGALVDRLQWVDLAPPVTTRTPCPPADTLDAAVRVPGRGGWVVCSSGRLAHLPDDGTPVWLGAPSPALVRVVSLAAAPSAAWLVAGTLDGEVVVLDAGTGAVEVRLPAGVGAVRHLAVGPDGVTLAVGEDGRVRLLRPRDGVRGQALALTDVVDGGWASDGSLRVATRDATWRVSPAAAVATGSWQEAGGISSLALDSSGTRLAVAVGSEVVRRTWPEGRRLGVDAVHTRRVKAVTFVGDTLVSGGVDASGALVWHGPGEAGPASNVSRLRRVVATGSGHVLGVSYGHTVWVTAPGAREADAWTLETAFLDAVAAGAGSEVLAMDDRGAVWALDLATSHLTQREEPADPPEDRLAVSADGRWLARVGPGGVRVTDLSAHTDTVVPTSSPIDAVAFAPTGPWLALGCRDGVVAVHDVVANARVWEAYGHADRVAALAWDARGGLASGGWDGVVRVWDPVTEVQRP